MSRPIKFRVWSNTLNTMLNPNECKFTYKNGDIINVDSTLFSLTSMLSDYTLEQFTGLTDKNGVEIYDGDKIKLHKDYSVASNKIMQEGTIRWCNDGYWCVASDYSINDYNRNNKPLSNFPLDSFVVIGNIHD